MRLGQIMTFQEIAESLKLQGFVLALKIGSENLAQKISPTQDGFFDIERDTDLPSWLDLSGDV